MNIHQRPWLDSKPTVSMEAVLINQHQCYIALTRERLYPTHWITLLFHSSMHSAPSLLSSQNMHMGGKDKNKSSYLTVNKSNRKNTNSIINDLIQLRPTATDEVIMFIKDVLLCSRLCSSFYCRHEGQRHAVLKHMCALVSLCMGEREQGKKGKGNVCFYAVNNPCTQFASKDVQQLHKLQLIS